MDVELDVFSGRPNPRWQLTERETAEVARLIAGLEPARDPTPTDMPGLGYRGFRLVGPGRNDYRVCRGYVLSPESAMADPNRLVEKFLLEHMPAALTDLRSWLEAEHGLA